MNRRFWLRLHGLLFVLLLLTVLGLAGWLSQRHAVSWYWGNPAGASLSEPSRRLLERLPGEVRAVAFVPPGHLLSDHLRQLLSLYAEAKPAFRFELINPELRPELVRALGVEALGEVVLEYGGRRERVRVPTEAHLSAALERLLRGQGQLIGFLGGHGERSLLGEANHDLGAFGQALSRKGYRLQPLSLARLPAVPEEVDLLLLTPPQVDLLPGELAALQGYVERGGALLWLGDPDEAQPLAALAARLGVDWLPGVVVDPLAAETLAVDDGRLVLLDRLPDHPAAGGIEAPLLLPQAQALAVSEGWRPLLVADNGQWRSERHPPAAAPAATPPLLLGATRERERDGGRQRIAVIGDADFLSNAYLGNGANLPLGLNLVDWLVAAEVPAGSYARAAPDQTLALSGLATAVIGFGFLLILPLVFAAAAGICWWRRRRG